MLAGVIESARAHSACVMAVMLALNAFPSWLQPLPRRYIAFGR